MTQKAIITFTDGPDGQVLVNLTFDPPVDGKTQVTGATHMALTALQAVQNNSYVEEDDYDDDEQY